MKMLIGLQLVKLYTYIHMLQKTWRNNKEKEWKCVCIYTYVCKYIYKHKDFLFPNNDFILKPLKIYGSIILIT